MGKSLPKYANASLDLAVRFSGLEVHLLGSSGIKSDVRSKLVHFTAIEDFYKPEEFKQTSNLILSDASFRNGFWLKTLERFFVLEQFYKAAKLKGLFHAELDQLLFRNDILLSRLESLDHRGVFFPFHSRAEGIASLFYCNNYDALRSLINFSSRNVFSNEMALLADWAAKEPEHVFALPTLGSVIDTSSSAMIKQVHEVLHKEIGGIVDAAQIGQWVGGIDPNNVPIRQIPRTKFVNTSGEKMLSREQLQRLEFELDRSNGCLSINFDRKISSITYNLHLHSKVHNSLSSSDSAIYDFFRWANLNEPRTLRGTRKVQLLGYARSCSFYLFNDPSRLVSALRRRINRLFNFRPPSYPFVSGDTFRDLSDHVWEKSYESIAVEDIKPNQIIFCKSELLDTLNERVLSKLNIPIALILGNSDRNHIDEIPYLAQNENVKMVFAQNLGRPLAGMEVLPIGLENAWMAKNGSISAFRRQRYKSTEKKYRLMWTFTVSTNFIERKAAAAAMIHSPIADRLGSIDPQSHREALAEYAFVLSPPGNGLDTHRTWEAMYLKCVPIVTRSYLSEYYEGIGLPVWIIDSYDDVATLSEDQLREKYRELEHKFESPALWLDYWSDQIHAALRT